MLCELKTPVRRRPFVARRRIGLALGPLAEQDVAGLLAFAAGDYSIADMACYPWVRGMAMLNPGIHEGFDDLAAWIARIGERDAVKRADQKGRDLVHAAAAAGREGEQARNVLFGQRAQR